MTKLLSSGGQSTACQTVIKPLSKRENGDLRPLMDSASFIRAMAVSWRLCPHYQRICRRGCFPDITFLLRWIRLRQTQDQGGPAGTAGDGKTRVSQAVFRAYEELEKLTLAHHRHWWGKEHRWDQREDTGDISNCSVNYNTIRSICGG